MIHLLHTDGVTGMYQISFTLLMICLLHTGYPPPYYKKFIQGEFVSDFLRVCMHKKCLFQIKSTKKPVKVFKTVVKKMFSLQNVMEKIV